MAVANSHTATDVNAYMSRAVGLFGRMMGTAAVSVKFKVFHLDAGRMIKGGASAASDHDAEAFDKALVAAHDARGEGRQRGSVCMTCCVQYRVPQGGGVILFYVMILVGETNTCWIDDVAAFD